MMYQCGRCGLIRASGQEMGVIQQCKCPWEFTPPVMKTETTSNKKMIKLLRDISVSAPLPMGIHDRITKALLELLNKKEVKA
jgi:hypothetical protein